MKKQIKKFLSVALAVLMLASVIPFSVNAATVVASGECGDNLTWELDSEGIFTVSGTGAMRDAGDYGEEGEEGQAFYDQIAPYKEQIKKIVVNNGVTTIGYGVFEQFINLTSVSLPESVVSIYGNAFASCTKLTSVSLPESVVSIYDNAFAGCTKLTSIILPQSLERLSAYAFLLTPIKTLHIPANVKYIGGPLVMHADFEGYTVDENNEYFSADKNGSLFNNDKTKLIHLNLDPTVKEYTVPDSVTTIGNNAIFGFYLEKINIPDTVKSIGAIGGNLALKELNLPKHLEILNCYSEYNNIFLVGFEKLTIPEVDSFGCDSNYDPEVSCNHYDLFNYLLLSEITVYDRDMDFSGLTIGLAGEKFTSDGLKTYRDTYSRYVADVMAYNYGYGDTIPEEPNFNEDEIFVKDAEVDFVIEDTDYYKIPNFTVRCYLGSTAEEYAKKYDFNIKYLCEEHTEEIIPAVLPTCTATGLTEGKKCSVCDEILTEQTTVEAKGHDYTAALTAPTCTEQGFTTYTCDCGDSYVSDYVAKTEHNYKSEITEEPLCKENGTKVYYCDCGYSYTETVKSLGHVDEDNNNSCDRCGVGVCDHMCHKDGFFGFIWKIINFFGKLFGSNPTCECGIAHY